MTELRNYGVRDLLNVIDVKPHVLRYWEQTLPLVRSRRDESGHRIWSSAQVRILHRLRHLIVERGISVGAAGELIIQEAAGRGDVKADLEELRHYLVTVLHRLRSSHRSPQISSGLPAAEATAPTVERSAVSGGALDVVASGLIPTPSGRTPRVHRRGVLLQARQEFPSECADTSDRWIRVAFRHLSAYDPGGRNFYNPLDPFVPALLRDLLAIRLTGETPTIVCAPGGGGDLYRQTFAEWTGPPVFILEVAPLCYRAQRWVAPLAGVLLTLLQDPHWREQHDFQRRPWLYLWSADNPDSPADPPGIPHMSEKTPAILLHLLRQKMTHLLGESLLLYGGEETTFPRLLERGRWWIGPVVERDPSGADTVRKGWRFDLWVHDLTGSDVGWTALPRSNRPALWRGYDWYSQLRGVWPELSERRSPVSSPEE